MFTLYWKIANYSCVHQGYVVSNKEQIYDTLVLSKLNQT